MKTYTKESLIAALRDIRDQEWIASLRPGNAGTVGNTIEELLGIEENNLPIPNAAEWELKAQRANTSSLLTLFHSEPSPTAMKFVPSILLPQFGWAHKEAGKKYDIEEKSFRQTIQAVSFSDRGFCVRVDRSNEKIEVVFDAEKVDLTKHHQWFSSVQSRTKGEFLSCFPYWGFDDFFHKAGAKLHNCFYLIADVKKENKKEFFHYKNIRMLKGLSKLKLIEAVEQGDVYVDFDARTGHNHGTKFRIKPSAIPNLYDEVTII